MNTTTSSDWAEKQAHSILDEFTPLPEWEYMKRHEILVKNLLAAAKVPEGCVRIGDVQVLYRGHLPYTKDRVLIVPGIHPECVWNNDQWHNHAEAVRRPDGRWGAYFGDQWRFIEDCYSTRQAAEAAQAARGEGK